MSNVKQRSGKVSDITGRGMRADNARPCEHLIDSTTLVGVEAEIENYSCSAVIDSRDGWTVKSDGSLRNGHEFVFDGPRKGSQISDSIRIITSTITHNSSPRAGTHVHVDWLDVEEAESLYRLAVIVAVIEEGIYKYVGPDRVNNTFLAPLAKNDLRSLATALASESEGEFASWAVNGSRYRGTNFTALRRYGSVEFRYFPAITTYEEVMSWINMCLMLKRAAVDRTKGMSATELAGLLTSPEFIESFLIENFSEYGIGATLVANMDLRKRARVAKALSAACRGIPLIGARWAESAASNLFLQNYRQHRSDAQQVSGVDAIISNMQDILNTHAEQRGDI